MKKFISQKSFLQKIILTMLVGLFLGGCSLDTRKPFYYGSVKKTFLEYFTDGHEYDGGFEYYYNDGTPYIIYDGTKYTFNGTVEGNDMVGTFGYNRELTATVDTSTTPATITVTADTVEKT